MYMGKNGSDFCGKYFCCAIKFDKPKKLSYIEGVGNARLSFRNHGG